MGTIKIWRSLMKMVNVVALFFAVMFFATLGWAEQHDSLTPLLTDLEGWKAEPAKGMSMAADKMKIINAVRNYQQGKKKLAVTIFVNSGPATANQMKDFSMTRGDVTTKTSQIDGFWVTSIHNGKKEQGQLVILLAHNQETNSLVTATYSGIKSEDALKLVKKFKWKKLKEVTVPML